MPQLLLSDSFFRDRLPHLSGQERAHFLPAFEKFRSDSRAPALDLEPYRGARDSRFRTLRLSDGLRAIVWAFEGDQFVLDDIVSHDEAKRIARRRRSTIDTLTGAVRFIDAVSDVEGAPSGGGEDRRPPLFAAIGDKALGQLGVSPHVRRLLRRLTDEEDMEALARLAPRDEMRAAELLRSGLTPEQAYERMQSEPLDCSATDDASVLDRSIGAGTVHILRSESELRAAFSEPFEWWRVFLHPSQRHVAEHAPYNGPAKVLGGPGTGKTVVAMHRARHLAAAQRGFFAQEHPPRILFAAFSTSLAGALERNLKLLCGDDLAARIQVRTVDSVAREQIRRITKQAPPQPIEDGPLRAMIDDALAVGDRGVTGSTVLREWSDVIVAQNLSSREEYLTASRRGMGRGLPVAQREHVWQVVDAVRERLEHDGRSTYQDIVRRAAWLLGQESEKPYDHILVDEAQDLRGGHWRMLRAAVAEGPDDLFIVGDGNQRIFGRILRLSDFGILCAGARTTRLTFNYRTTSAIMELAIQLLDGVVADDLDGGSEPLTECRCLVDGTEPELAPAGTEEMELGGVAGAIRRWSQEGLAFEDMAVMCRTNPQCTQVAERLRQVGIGATILARREDGVQPGSVAVLTMHRSKGLEFRAVAITGVHEGNVPHPKAASQEEDATDAERDERRLLFTACTRARERLRVSWHGKPSPFLKAALSRADLG